MEATLAPPGVRRRSFTLHTRPNSFIQAHIGIRDPRASPICALTISSRLPPRGAAAAAALPPLHMRQHRGTRPRLEQRSKCAKRRRRRGRSSGVRQARRAASGLAAAGGRGGWLPYRPIEDVPLHGLRGEGQPRAARGRPRRPSARGQRAARGTRVQGVGRHADGLAGDHDANGGIHSRHRSFLTLT
ncbi:hypothetical protein PVAP13_4NG266300 [Panicum virgatum]|uniref:Uncharacterized protein n=1 Tax=Panicum virgatum TaxID=38727 RepID=A0A8T0TCQ4_PANVG|nr:hypothetical protein PVAP13_4NG266300 [Panicum virgatum]